MAELRIITASKILGFCKLHRIIIIYNCYSYIVIKLKQMFGAFYIFKIFKPIHIIIGIILLVYAIVFKVILKNKTNNNI